MKGPRLFAACVVAGLAVAAAPAQAATINVTTNQDEFNTSGTGAGCSLREAVQAANTDSAFGGCTAGSGPDVIDLQGSTTYAIQVISGCTAATMPDDTNHCGDFDISSDLTLEGAGAGSTIVSGGDIDRPFDVHSPANVTIAGVTIEHGEPASNLGMNTTNLEGGGIRNSGTLTLNSDDVLDDTAAESTTGNGRDGGGIYNTGNLTLNSTTVDHDQASSAITSSGGTGGNGGGIANEASGTLTLNGSTVLDDNAGNAASGLAGEIGGFGGGIYDKSSGSLMISNATISGNRAGVGAQTGGGGGGGGLDASGSGTVTISGTAISGNTGGTAPASGIGGSGGGLLTGATTTLTNSTVANNTAGGSGSGGRGDGGGLDVQGSTTLTNDTLSGNAVGAGVGGMFGGGIENSGTTSLANTIVASSTGPNCSGTAVTDGGHNVSFAGTSNGCPAGFATGDPNLGMLQNNGGLTDTMSVAGAVAVDQVPATGSSCPATDQRGIVRPQGAACDIGAFEVVVPATLAVSKSGSGSGNVTSSPAGINCGATCSAQYTEHTSVTLTATADSGSHFAGWSGGGCSGAGTCTVPMAASTTVAATFTANPPPPEPPNTKIEKAKINRAKHKATFTFTALPNAKAASGFQCALAKKTKKLKFKSCRSPKTYKHLKPAKYTFEVRAIDSAGRDATPAKKKFHIKP